MNILVVGGGGREHAMVWKISRSPYTETIYCAPGNAGISQLAQCVDIPVTDIKRLLHFAEKNSVDLTVVGPELPLSLGIVDLFHKNGRTIFGPSQRAAQIEASKVFAKAVMTKFNIPTAEYKEFLNAGDAEEYIKKKEPPFVVKADGLAEGKGVLICTNRKEALDGVNNIMKKKVFGDAGDKLIIEEYLTGEEASVLAITDGEKIAVLPSAQDHKAIFEGDTGPNTGGMGAYAPATITTPQMLQAVRNRVFIPLIRGLQDMGIPYRGVIYAGLMITPNGPKVLEFNCRFGDPETQAILPLLKTDLVDLMIESAEGRLKNEVVQISNQWAVCVVMASGGYPGHYEKGKVIQGVNQVPKDVLVFHAGTKRKDDHLVTSGGRVLGVTALGDSISLAIEKAYKAIGKIAFDGAYYRRDIGQKALARKMINRISEADIRSQT
jgi:phosphoribosylamine--glycine ligase